MLIDGVGAVEGSDISVGRQDSTLIAYNGNLVVANKFARWHPHIPITLNKVIVSVGEAPTGSSIQININKNGSPITAVPIDLAVSQTSIETSAFVDDTATTSDHYTFDLLQVGSSVTGRDLIIQLNFTVG